MASPIIFYAYSGFLHFFAHLVDTILKKSNIFHDKLDIWIFAINKSDRKNKIQWTIITAYINSWIFRQNENALQRNILQHTVLYTHTDIHTVIQSISMRYIRNVWLRMFQRLTSIDVFRPNDETIRHNRVYSNSET